MARGQIPFDYVLDELAVMRPRTNPMFGCTAVYVGSKIVMILRDGKADDDNGVWLATSHEHHASLVESLPSIRSIGVLNGGSGETGWRIIPRDNDGFEEEVLLACRLVRANDPRIGKLPGKKRAKKEVGRGPRAAGLGKGRVPAKRKPASATAKSATATSAMATSATAKSAKPKAAKASTSAKAMPTSAKAAKATAKSAKAKSAKPKSA
jgi:hypothetical protein